MKGLVFSAVCVFCSLASCKNDSRPKMDFDHVLPGAIYFTIGDSIKIALTEMLCSWQDDSLFQISGWDSTGQGTFFARGIKTTDHQYGRGMGTDYIPCNFFFYSKQLHSLIGNGTIIMGTSSGGLLTGNLRGTLYDSTRKTYRISNTFFWHIPNLGAEPDSFPSYAGPAPRPKHHVLPQGFHPFATYTDQYIRK